ncbi:MAG: hypothetical protein KC621_06990 [Myxococcales bacterium]|nr:hypothetical protein [Myxococcales bacterium]
MRLCRYLRWKTYYGARWDTPEQLAEDLARGDVPFSCLRTCLPWGPDEGPAVPEGCQPDRACFVPSAKEPLPDRASNA